MASLSRTKSGTRRILYVDPRDGKRRTLWLGRCSQRLGDAVRVKLEHLLNSIGMGGPLDNDVVQWVNSIGDELHGKLADAGLVQPRIAVRLGEFLNDYRASRTDIKPQTVVHWGHTIRNLLDFFGDEKPLRDITEQDAIAFRAFLVGQKLAEATVRRRTGLARQFFTAAKKRKLIGENPFKQDDLPTAVGGNSSRQFFITREMTDQILANCPDVEWRLLVCLARYGGMRTPSESLRLRWRDIDWERSRFTVTSPKTEHHAGHESRIVPLFPELIEPLQECFEASPDGAEYCINRYRPNNLNLRTHFRRIIKRAGLQPWPRLWQNLRSSRQSELCEEFPEFVVCAWIGNSKAVAREHYLQILPEHFQRATQRARQRAQYPAKHLCTPMQPTPAEGQKNADFGSGDMPCAAMQMAGMGPAGFEPAAKGL